MSSYSESNSQCQFCGYSLAGLRTGVCPECGRPVFRFTDRAREVMKLANRCAIDIATRRVPVPGRWDWWMWIGPRAVTIAPAHVLVALLEGPHGVGRHAAQQLAGDVEELARQARALAPRVPRVEVTEDVKLPLDPSTRKVVNAAIGAALTLGHDWVGTEHLLLGLLERGKARTRRLLCRHGVSAGTVRAFVLDNMARIGEGSSGPG